MLLFASIILFIIGDKIYLGIKNYEVLLTILWWYIRILIINSVHVWAYSINCSEASDYGAFSALIYAHCLTQALKQNQH